jgi:hypothetical protein
MLTTVVGGLVGLAIGYYVLMWLRGPDIDVLNVAQYLPESMLPSSFQSKTPQVALTAPTTAPQAPAPAETAEDAATPAETAEVTESAESEPSTDTAATPSESSTPPAEGVETASASAVGDRYATESAQPATESTPAEIPASEPAVLEPPAAAPLADGGPGATPATVANAPSFTATDVEASLAAAKEAQPKLMAGSLTDSDAVKTAKGKAYLALADLSQKVTFASQAEAAVSQADELFKTTLADEHTRTELAQIAPKWISFGKRSHNGVFFAGSLGAPENKGSVIESVCELAPGKSVTLLVPTALASQLTSGQQIGVIGWIVDGPVDHVSGYTGSAQQAIFVGRLVALQ